MSVEQEQPPEQSHESSDSMAAFESDWAWKGGALAGLVATVVMGVAISAMNLGTLQLAIPGLYGLEGNLVAGWIAHVAHGTIFGLIFAGFMADPGLYRISDWVWKTLVAGIVFGMMLAIVGAGIVMPIWLGAAGFTTPPSIPNITKPMLLWHFIYGTVLGLLYPFVEDL